MLNRFVNIARPIVKNMISTGNPHLTLQRISHTMAHTAELTIKAFPKDTVITKNVVETGIKQVFIESIQMSYKNKIEKVSFQKIDASIMSNDLYERLFKLQEDYKSAMLPIKLKLIEELKSIQKLINEFIFEENKSNENNNQGNNNCEEDTFLEKLLKELYSFTVNTLIKLKKEKEAKKKKEALDKLMREFISRTTQNYSALKDNNLEDNSKLLSHFKNKVLNFIKSVINKIKELYSKIIPTEELEILTSSFYNRVILVFEK